MLHHSRRDILFLLVMLLWPSLAGHSQSGSPAAAFEQAKRDPERLRTLLKEMPKGGELHLHLSAAVRFDRLLDIAIRHGYRVGFQHDTLLVCGFARPALAPQWEEPCRPGNVVFKPAAELSEEERKRLHEALTVTRQDADRDEKAGFAEFIRVFARLEELVGNADVIPKLVQEAMEQAAAHKVSYLELKLNPIGRKDSKGKPMKIEELVARLTAAAAEKNRQLAPGKSVTVKFIVLLHRRNPQQPGGITDVPAIACTPDCSSRLRQGYFVAARRLAGTVVGIDLAGLPEEEVGSPGYLPVAFQMLRDEFGEASITLHAGETRNPSWTHHIAQAIAAGANRIGHAFNLEHTAEAKSLVCERRILLEISLTSNLLIGLLPQDDLRAHPFPRYFRGEICPKTAHSKRGYLPVTLNTDDPGVFQTDLTQEFFLATTTFDLSWDEVKQLCRNSLTRAFATPAERQALLQRWEREMAEFEATRLRAP